MSYIQIPQLHLLMKCYRKRFHLNAFLVRLHLMIVKKHFFFSDLCCRTVSVKIIYKWMKIFFLIEHITGFYFSPFYFCIYWFQLFKHFSWKSSWKSLLCFVFMQITEQPGDPATPIWSQALLGRCWGFSEGYFLIRHSLIFCDKVSL